MSKRGNKNGKNMTKYDTAAVAAAAVNKNRYYCLTSQAAADDTA